MIEGTDVYEYFMCPYKVYNRHHRSRSLMVPLSDFSNRLMELGREHEKELVSSIKFEKPEYTKGDLSKGFLQTVKLMQIGAEIIYQGVVKDGDYLGIPDLLIKQKGKSRYGDYHYIPAEIKLSTRSKDEQIMQLMFYDMVLEKVQGASSKKGIIILKNSSEKINLENYQGRFSEALSKINEISNGLEYGMHIDSTCKDCPWRNVCVPLAEKNNDVSLVYGLSRPAHYKIIDMGIKTLKDLKKADTPKIVESLGTTENVVERWKEQANVFITKKPKINKVELPKTKNHVCLDIETAEDGGLYLIGLWNKKKFTYFFSENDEKKIIDGFIDYVLALKDCKLYHYGIYERTEFGRLFEKYNIDENIRKEIFSKMVDLFTLVKRNAMLPLRSYGLKDVAKCMGFKWRASDASGSNSIMWYEEWKKNKDKKLLKKILDYNEDDVKATYVVLKKISKGKV